MALRHPQALLSRFQRAGLICIASQGRTCLAHGLPETPDTVLFSPTNHASGTVGAFLESWGPVHVSFVNSVNAVVSIYLRLSVEHSIVQ